MEYFDLDMAVPQELDLFAEELPSQEKSNGAPSIASTYGYCWICWSE